MRVLTGIVLGLFSGLLIYMIAAIVSIDPANSSPPSNLFVSIFLLGGWIGSTYFLLNQTRSTLRLISKGALLGATEWILLAIAGVVMSGRSAAAAVSSSSGTAESTGAVLGGGLAAVITGGLSLAMAVLSLLVFLVVYLIGKEKVEVDITLQRKCPMCAEMILKEAQKCRHCGSSLSSL